MIASRIARFFGVLGAVALFGVSCQTSQDTTLSPLPFGGMYRSDDGGITFHQKARLDAERNLTGVTPVDVTLDPFQPEAIYLAGAESGLLRTEDGGEHWELLNTPTASVTSVVIHPRNPHILYITGRAQGSETQSRIWKTFDRGEQWEEIYAEPLGGRSIEGGIFQLRRPTNPSVMSLMIDPQSPEVIYAGSSSGALVTSTDGGTTWSTRHSFRQGVSGLKISPLVNGQMFFRFSDGSLGRSDDGGGAAKRLSVSTDTTTATVIHAVFLSPRAPNHVLVGTDQGVFRSSDAGETWEVVPLPVSENALVRVSTIAEGSDGVLWAGSNFNLYSSKDNGSTWHVQQFPFSKAIRFVLVDPTHPRRLYLFFLP